MEDDEFEYLFGDHIRFKKHPKEDDVKIDWCPFCGETLDFKIKTRDKHDKRYHPGYFTTITGIKQKDFFKKEDLK